MQKKKVGVKRRAKSAAKYRSDVFTTDSKFGAASMMQSRAFSNDGRYEKSHNITEFTRSFSFFKLKLKPLSESLDVFVILMAMILLILEN